MTRKGLLLAMMEPPPAIEEEFQDWYDTEHVPERARVPGFETAMRFVCTSGWPRYMALYDLAEPGVLDGDGYRAISGERFSPWSKRILAKVRGQWRFAGEQVEPGDRATDRGLARLVLLRFSGATAEDEPSILQGMRAVWGDDPNCRSLRLFRSVDTGSRADYVVLAGLGAEAPLPADCARHFGSAAQRIDIVNAYSRHWPHGHLPGVY